MKFDIFAKNDQGRFADDAEIIPPEFDYPNVEPIGGGAVSDSEEIPPEFDYPNVEPIGGGAISDSERDVDRITQDLQDNPSDIAGALNAFERFNPEDGTINFNDPLEWSEKAVEETEENLSKGAKEAVETAGKYSEGLWKELPKAVMDTNFRMAEYIPAIGPIIEDVRDTAAHELAKNMPGGDTMLRGEERRRKFREDYPSFDPVAQFVGQIPTYGAGRAAAYVGSKIPGVAKATKWMNETGGFVPSLARTGANVIARTGNVALDTAIAAADAYTRGDVPLEQAIKDAGGMSALFNAAGFAKDAGKAFYSRFFVGIPHETAQFYIKNKDYINNLLSKKVDKETGLTPVDRLTQEVEQARFETTRPVREAKFEKEQATQAWKDEKSDLNREMNKIGIDTELPDTLIDAAKKMQQDISNRSSEAFDILIKEGKLLLIHDLRSKVQKQIRDMKLSTDKELPEQLVGNRKKSLELINETINSIIKQSEDNKIKPKEFYSTSPVDAKRVLQALDNRIADFYDDMRSGIYTPLDIRMIMEFRTELDDALKIANPRYAKVMKPLSSLTRNKVKVDRMIGNYDQIYNRLNVLDKPSQRDNLEAIRKLDTETKSGIMPELEKVFGKRAVWQKEANRTQMRTRLPSYEKMKDAQEKYDRVKSEFSPVTKFRPENIGNMNARTSYRSSEAERAARMMQDATGKDLTNKMRAFSVGNAITQPYVHGSRNVNLGRSVAGGISQLFGLGGLIPELGGAVGGVLDTGGRQLWKFFTDASTSGFGKISISLLEALKRGGAREFTSTMDYYDKNNPEFAAWMRKYIEAAGQKQIGQTGMDLMPESWQNKIRENERRIK
jgi:hypothetical protein